MNATRPFAPPSLDQVHAACATVNDPEFGLSIVDLGLIYDVALNDTAVIVRMTLTTPSCPAGGVIANAISAAVAAVPGITEVDVQLVWDPRWTPDMVSARGRAQLGWR